MRFKSDCQLGYLIVFFTINVRTGFRIPNFYLKSLFCVLFLQMKLNMKSLLSSIWKCRSIHKKSIFVHNKLYRWGKNKIRVLFLLLKSSIGEDLCKGTPHLKWTGYYLQLIINKLTIQFYVTFFMYWYYSSVQQMCNFNFTYFSIK